MTLKVAMFTPGPPLQSGGAVYAGSLLAALAERADVTAVSPVPIAWDGPTVAPDDVRPGDHDVLVHFLGNNPDHLFAYRSALRLGGVVACHDLGLRHVLGGYAPDDELADLSAQLGPEGAAALRSRWAHGVATEREAFLHLLVGRPLRQARAVVVHSRYARFVLSAELPWVPVFQVPSHTGALPDDLAPAWEVRERLGLPASAFVVGLFGYLGGHKRVPQTLDGVAAAAAVLRRRGVDLRLVLVGAAFATDLRALAAERGLSAATTVVGAVDDRAFFEHMGAVDAIVNLRYPTMGETSATLVQAEALGKPVLTSDYAQFAEERACIHVPVDEREVGSIAAALVRLATCSTCASLVSDAARRRAAELTLDRTADAWMHVLESVALQLSPPERRVVGPSRAHPPAVSGLPRGEVDLLRLVGAPAGDPARVLAAAYRALSSAGRLEWSDLSEPAMATVRSGLEEAGLRGSLAAGGVLVADKVGSLPRP